MKKWMAALLAVLMLATMLSGSAQEVQPEIAPYGGRTPEEAYEELIVGTTTKPAGGFFTDMWGNNTTDIDVRSLIHGYNLMNWQGLEGAYMLDGNVATGLMTTQDAQGNRTYTVALAQDLTYNDGTPITAADYVFSVLLSAAPEMKEIGATVGRTDYIVGAEAFSLGETKVLSGVRLLGDHLFSVKVSARYLPYFYEMAFLNFTPYPISVIAPGCRVADDGQGAYIGNLDENEPQPVFTADLLRQTVLDEETGYKSHPAVSSGPYALTGYDAQTGTVTLARNPNYRGDENGQRPTIERITLKTVENETMLADLEAGRVDLLNKVVYAEAVNQGVAMIAEGNLYNSNYLRSGLTLISFTCEQGPAQFQKVRQAVAMCLDRETFIREYVSNYGVQVNGYYGVGQWMTQLVNGTLAAPVEEPAEDAAPEMVDAYDQAIAAWEALSLDELNPYGLDVDAARALLIEDGWTLNAQGGDFDETADAVRCKLVDGELMPLSMKLVVPEGNQAEALLDQTLAANLAGVGAQLSIETTPFDQMLAMYYRQTERDCDMFYLGTNFQTVYDPANSYSLAEDSQGTLNTTGLLDQQLYDLAVAMNRTEPGDVLSYCQKWVAFQQRWNEMMPAVPIYSNVYFDLYTDRLQNYQIAGHESWAQAVLYAYLSDAMEQEQAQE